MFTAATTFEIVISLPLHPPLLSSPIYVPEKVVGLNKKDRIKKKDIPISSKGLA